MAQVRIEMGMQAMVTAIGKFSETVREHLEYPANFYANTTPGKLVFSILFQCNTTGQSRELADILGIDPWDFDKHVLNLTKLTPEAKQRLTELPDGTEDLEHLDALIAANFIFVYRPNG
jgi:hypothetical protein